MMLQGLPPRLASNTRLVVLGSFPGEASLRAQQYYGHPRNQFWPILTELFSNQPSVVCALPYAQRMQWLLEQGVGVWDVYAACTREGSLDANIQSAEINDLHKLRVWCPNLTAIAHNGGESYRHARITRTLGLPVYRLPSTSPANASWSLQRKRDAWRDVMVAVGLLRSGDA